jgi:pyruvate,water dikinase
MSDAIYRLDNLPAACFSLAGGKGASLARMAQGGYPVPAGWVILVAGFAGGSLTPETRQALLANLAAFRAGEPGASFAVRSSAPNEDLSLASFAGAYETVLNVKTDEEILAAVGRVIESAAAERVQAYTQTCGLGENHAMAVVVQRMVQPEFAGVLFTADPITGSHSHMTGNYVHGLGEQLVSGQVNAQDFQVQRPGGKYRGPGECARYARRLYQLASRLEKEFGCALDIEWASAGGQVYLLQARPVTTLQTINYDTYAVNESLDKDYLWTNNNIGEALTDVMTPFTWSVVRELDVETQKIDGYYLWSGNICGRGYSNVSLIFSFMGKVGLGLNYSKKLVGNVFGKFPEAVDMPMYPMGLIDLMKDMSWRARRNFQRIQDAKKHKDEYIRQARPWCEANIQRIQSTNDPALLLSLWTGEIRPFVSKMWTIFLGGASDLTLLTLLDRLAKMVGVEDANSLLSNIRGEAGLESLGPLVGVAQVSRGELSRQEYLARHGHRSPHEFEMSIPYPVEDPGYLDQQIAEYRQSEIKVDDLLARQRQLHLQARQRFIERYPSKRKWLDNNLVHLGKAAQARESLRGEFTRTFQVMRAFMVKVGELTGIGSDVFFLYSFELPRLLTGNRSMLQHIPARKHNYERYCTLPPLPMFIKGRFDPFEWAKRPDRRLDYFDADPKPVKEDQNPDIVTGFPGAAGVVEGTARVLADYSEKDTFLPGEILVTSNTNVGWTLLFPRAAAIVTDIGAPLSHAAIVARELGIPAVVGCGDATLRLHTGDRISVDGGQGRVCILK